MTKDFYRGKRTDNGEWIYGYYVKAEKLDKSGTECFIIEKSADGVSNVVIPETVGQCSGLLDKKRNPIFDGDICKGAWRTKFEVFWDKAKTSFQARTDCNSPNGRDLAYYANYQDGIIDVNVIGNIYDNPELLDV